MAGTFPGKTGTSAGQVCAQVSAFLPPVNSRQEALFKTQSWPIGMKLDTNPWFTGARADQVAQLNWYKSDCWGDKTGDFKFMVP